ncbi:MAG: thiamine phosphate synthase [Gammaproteobacteria bacterium]|nr:thiamine phosphate synthase [Gammaproteobacteria bacterium]
MPPPVLKGLYAITSEALCHAPERLPGAVDAALRGGAALIQYRDKWNDPATRRRQAAALLERCRAHGALLLINDDVELAAAVGADGVHVGRGDMAVDQARRRLGPGAIVGATCHNELARAQAALAAGASYVAFGRFFPSRTKPEAPPADLELLRQARARIPIPICAIGGITPDNARSAIQAGADLVAAVEGVFGAADIEAAARAYAHCFR